MPIRLEHSTTASIRQLPHWNAAVLEENGAFDAAVKQRYAGSQEKNSVEEGRGNPAVEENGHLVHTVWDQSDDCAHEMCSMTTTLIVRLTCRNDGTPKMLLSDLDLLGFESKYDYIYVPRTRKKWKGYAFVNMTDAVYARQLSDCVGMLKDPQRDPLELKWLDYTSCVQEARIQGRDQNLRQCWSICQGLWPVHDSLPHVRIEGKMAPVLPWEYLNEELPEDKRGTPQTLCLRGIPHQVCPVELMGILDTNGFEGSYSYFFMPCDVRSLKHRGYAFVHLDTQEIAKLFIERMNGYLFANHGDKNLRVGMALQQGVVPSLKKNTTIQYSGSLLFYPWVRVDGEMKCVSTDEALRICLKDLDTTRKESAESVGSTEMVSSDASTAIDD
jgi:hypothetical protein